MAKLNITERERKVVDYFLRVMYGKGGYQKGGILNDLGIKDWWFCPKRIAVIDEDGDRQEYDRAWIMSVYGKYVKEE